MQCVLQIKSRNDDYKSIKLNSIPPNNLIYINKPLGVFYSDWDYKLILKIDDNVESVDIYVNNIKLNYKKEDGLIVVRKNKPFINLYGYVSFKIFIKNNSKVFSLYSGYYDIAVRKKISNGCIREMAKYILTYSKKYLFSKDNTTVDFQNTIVSKYRNFETQISILDNIIKEYEINYKYFKSDTKFKLTSEFIVDNFEKLSDVKDETIKFMLTNPQYLIKVPYRTGIRYNNQNFQPKKTLISRGKCDYNIYENNVVVGFLKYLYNEISDKVSKISIEDNNNVNFTINPEYDLSGYDVKNEMKLIFNEYSDKLTLRMNKIHELYFRYKNILKCSELIVNTVPKPTQIFTQILHYKKVFKVIYQWFMHGSYDMKIERLLLTFPDVSRIYEYYILFKINNSINNIYRLKGEVTFHYKMDEFSKYENTEYENTFIFGDNKDVVVYYQPVVYTNNLSNQIGLFRNNDISFNMDELNKGNYYTPDYIIKIKHDSHDEYIIVDAKWQYRNDVIRDSFKKIVYKYIFSISCINKNDIISKIIIYNGKIQESQKDYIYNFYNSKFVERNESILPAALILSVNPDNKELHNVIMKTIQE